MGLNVVTVAVVTAFWAIVGIVLPVIVGRGPNKGVIQCSLVITAFCCYLFWLCCYMHQMNPLIGPSLHTETLIAIKYLWGGDHDFFPVNPNNTITTTTTTTTIATTTAN